MALITSTEEANTDSVLTGVLINPQVWAAGMPGGAVTALSTVRLKGFRAFSNYKECF